MSLFTISRLSIWHRVVPVLRPLGLLLALWWLAPAPAAHAQTWMVSTTGQIKLGVLDKYGALGQYSATFVVRDEKTGKEYQIVRQVPKGENGIDVLFPTEPSDPDYFKGPNGEAANPTPGGKYTWECRVNGKRAVAGHFTFPETGNEVNVISQR